MPRPRRSTRSYTVAMDDTSLNRVQRWVLTHSAERYAKLEPELRPIAMERDKFLFSARALGLWAGLVFGTAGTTAGLALGSPRVSVGLAFLLAALTFAGLFKVGLSVWLRPQRFTAKRMRRIGWIAMLATYAGAIASFRGELRPLLEAGAPWYEAVLRVVWRATPLQIMLLVAVLLLLTIVSAARREYMQRALEQARAERERDANASQLTQARLTLLQAQIQPHFLFNTLAALQHWVDVGDARAAPLLHSLTRFLRGSAELMLQAQVTLAQECEMAGHYLAIMQSRLGERLRFSIDIAPDCAAQLLPPGLVMTLVENAALHGVEPQLHGGEVCVQARSIDGVFELRVLDDGAGLRPDATDGVGLANSRERLAHQFGGRAELALTARRECAGRSARPAEPARRAGAQGGAADGDPGGCRQGSAARADRGRRLLRVRRALHARRSRRG